MKNKLFTPLYDKEIINKLPVLNNNTYLRSINSLNINYKSIIKA